MTLSRKRIASLFWTRRSQLWLASNSITHLPKNSPQSKNQMHLSIMRWPIHRVSLKGRIVILREGPPCGRSVVYSLLLSVVLSATSCLLNCHKNANGAIISNFVGHFTGSAEGMSSYERRRRNSRLPSAILGAASPVRRYRLCLVSIQVPHRPFWELEVLGMAGQQRRGSLLEGLQLLLTGCNGENLETKDMAWPPGPSLCPRVYMAYYVNALLWLTLRPDFW